jgi:hypothetical protein
MKTTLYALFLALSTFCANGQTIVIVPPPGAVVRVRSGTTLNAPGIATVPYGAFNVDCQTVGETVASPAGISSNIWFHLPIYNGYVAGVYVWVPPGVYVPYCGTPTPPITPPGVPVVGAPVVGIVTPPTTPITPPNVPVVGAPVILTPPIVPVVGIVAAGDTQSRP